MSSWSDAAQASFNRAQAAYDAQEPPYFEPEDDDEAAQALDELPVVFLVQRANHDGLYVFANEDDQEAYAALFPDAENTVANVINEATAARMITEETD